MDPDLDHAMTTEEREAQEDAEMKIEAQAYNSNNDGSSTHDQHWKPGFSNRFPWLGFGALVFVLVAAGACVLTLSLANGVSQRRWPEAIAPNVIVSVLNNVANLCFGIAISQYTSFSQCCFYSYHVQVTVLLSLGGEGRFRVLPSLRSIDRTSSAALSRTLSSAPNTSM